MIFTVQFQNFLTRLRRQESNTVEFEIGEQNPIDIFTYEAMAEFPDCICIDGQYVRTLYISGYPFIANTGWLDDLINFNHDIDISYHFREVPSKLAIPKLTRKITELESTKRAMIRNGKILSADLTDPLASALELRDKIQRGQEKLFQFAIYILLRAESLEELNENTSLLQSALSSRLFYTKVARYRQIEGLRSVLPRGFDELKQLRNLDSSSASLAFPFISSELVHDSGILYGINKSNNSLVMVDRFQLQNANSIIFAQSGSGKSYTTKVEILRQLMTGTSVIVIDPEREYKLLADSVNGAYIKLSIKSKERINPFDFSVGSRTQGDLEEHTQDLAQIISLMADGLSSREAASLDKAILNIYKGVSGHEPLLEDLYAELHKLGQLKLCERLEKYISGSLASVFNSPTNVELNNRLIVFDIKDLPESIRQLMLLIISNFVENKVKFQPEKRLLVIDEGWMLLEHDESARFISGIVRRARKYYLGVSIITQQANDFLSNTYGQAIASQSALRILMKQDTTTIKSVTDEFSLSDFERNYLLTCDRGDALIIADQIHAAVKIIASNDEHPLLTTKPSEVFGNL